MEHGHRADACLTEVFQPGGAGYADRHDLAGRKLQLQITLLAAHCGLFAGGKGIALGMGFCLIGSGGTLLPRGRAWGHGRIHCCL